MNYAFDALDRSSRNQSSFGKKTSAIVFAYKKFRHYLVERKFTVETDHSALQFLNNLNKPHGHFNRWALLLQDLDYAVQYKKGRLHQDAGSLSHIHLKSCWRVEMTTSFHFIVLSFQRTTMNYLLPSKSRIQFALQYDTFYPTRNCLKQVPRPHNRK